MGARKDMSVKEKCVRSDGRNLVDQWRKDKEARGATYAYASNTGQLRDIDPKETDFIMGMNFKIFSVILTDFSHLCSYKEGYSLLHYLSYIIQL